MEDFQIDRLVRQIGNEKIPLCPANLAPRVLRRIRLARAAGPASRAGWLLAMTGQLSYVLPALAIVILTSVVLAGLLRNSSPPRAELAKKALHFEVFTNPPLEGLNVFLGEKN